MYEKSVSLKRRLGAIHKGNPHKIAKNWPPLSAKWLHWLNLPCQCGHTINFENPEFCSKNCESLHLKTPPLFRKMSALDKPLPPWLRKPFIDGPLKVRLDQNIVMPPPLLITKFYAYGYYPFCQSKGRNNLLSAFCIVRECSNIIRCFFEQF